jgi:hypothetical protein
LKAKLCPDESSGIYGKVPEDSKIAWDAHQHLRRELSWHGLGKDWRKEPRDWKKMILVIYDEPLKASGLDGDFETELLTPRDRSR